MKLSKVIGILLIFYCYTVINSIFLDEHNNSQTKIPAIYNVYLEKYILQNALVQWKISPYILGIRGI